MRSLNAPDAQVSHAPLNEHYQQTPLCGFIADGEGLHPDWQFVDCQDCIAAR